MGYTWAEAEVGGGRKGGDECSAPGPDVAEVGCSASGPDVEATVVRVLPTADVRAAVDEVWRSGGTMPPDDAPLASLVRLARYVADLRMSSVRESTARVEAEMARLEAERERDRALREERVTWGMLAGVTKDLEDAHRKLTALEAARAESERVEAALRKVLGAEAPEGASVAELAEQAARDLTLSAGRAEVALAVSERECKRAASAEAAALERQEELGRVEAALRKVLGAEAPEGAGWGLSLAEQASKIAAADEVRFGEWRAALRRIGAALEVPDDWESADALAEAVERRAKELRAVNTGLQSALGLVEGLHETKATALDKIAEEAGVSRVSLSAEQVAESVVRLVKELRAEASVAMEAGAMVSDLVARERGSLDKVAALVGVSRASRTTEELGDLVAAKVEWWGVEVERAASERQRADEAEGAAAELEEELEAERERARELEARAADGWDLVDMRDGQIRVLLVALAAVGGAPVDWHAVKNQ